jgi:hypothetical protein
MALNCLAHSLPPANSLALHLFLLRWATLFEILIYAFAWLDSNFSGTLVVRVNIQHCAGVPAFTTLSKYRCNRAGRHADRQTDRQALCWWVAQSAECKRTKKTKERKWTFIRISRTGWMKVRRRCRTRSHLLLWCKKRDHRKYKDVFFYRCTVHLEITKILHSPTDALFI